MMRGIGLTSGAEKRFLYHGVSLKKVIDFQLDGLVSKAAVCLSRNCSSLLICCLIQNDNLSMSALSCEILLMYFQPRSKGK